MAEPVNLPMGCGQCLRNLKLFPPVNIKFIILVVSFKLFRASEHACRQNNIWAQAMLVFFRFSHLGFAHSNLYHRQSWPLLGWCCHRIQDSGHPGSYRCSWAPRGCHYHSHRSREHGSPPRPPIRGRSTQFGIGVDGVDSPSKSSSIFPKSTVPRPTIPFLDPNEPGSWQL